MAEVPRDHATLDKLLKKQDKNYYTDDLLGRLTLNDKQYAVWESSQFEGTDTADPIAEDLTPVGEPSVLNPIEIDGEIVPFLQEPAFEIINPVSEEAEPTRDEPSEPLLVVDAAMQAEATAVAESEPTTADDVAEEDIITGELV